MKTSLNAFSFNAALTDGSMTISNMLDFCGDTGFEGVDITGYYFKGYPVVPSDDYLFGIKRKAFNLGIGISGTGVRNDFTIADKTNRELEVSLVKNWIEVAAKIGAPVIRIFAGNQKNEGLTTEQVNKIIEAINSEWLGLILDTGSYRVLDPYDEIAKSVKHAVNWQFKENVFMNGAEKETDMVKLMGIIKRSGYKGYLPIETLGDGDPKTKIKNLLTKVQKALIDSMF